MHLITGVDQVSLILSDSSFPTYDRRIGYAILAAHVISLFIVLMRIGFGRLNSELLEVACAMERGGFFFVLSLFFAPFWLYIEFWRLAIATLRPSREKKL